MGHYKAVIVEDDPMVASINCQYLQLHPQIQLVGQFQNGKEALSFLRGYPVDLAIIDYYMPLMDGRELILNCRKEDIPLDIIMITAASSAQEASGILQIGGIVDYLIKPFTMERFHKSIERFLSIKQILHSASSLNQKQLDKIMAPQTVSHLEQPLEKGLQEQTLLLLRNYLNCHANQFLSSNEIAQEVGLSRITIRRYMNYLLKNHEIISQVDYSTGGRPSIKYKKR